jgi:hypothetical protein
MSAAAVLVTLLIRSNLSIFPESHLRLRSPPAQANTKWAAFIFPHMRAFLPGDFYDR